MEARIPKSGRTFPIGVFQTRADLGTHETYLRHLRTGARQVAALFDTTTSGFWVYGPIGPGGQTGYVYLGVNPNELLGKRAGLGDLVEQSEFVDELKYLFVRETAEEALGEPGAEYVRWHRFATGRPPLTRGRMLVQVLFIFGSSLSTLYYIALEFGAVPVIIGLTLFGIVVLPYFGSLKN